MLAQATRNISDVTKKRREGVAKSGGVM